ncbi:short-subunit dehydrogenase [Prauserella shujinwangii]|uniref:Short-subunit dehydrogenase n=1 Tax=Prauserella shujinwangii TaxID=1453103 RepID=A0A2T0LM70_9PSEU|nr:short-subunit dehydrogenase [Prauserella shujinwangii]
MVTGATSGLGRYVAGELAEAGATVLAHGRNADRLRAVRAGPGAQVLRADLADLRQVERLAEEIRQRHGPLDGLVNNAGVGSGPGGDGREVSADGIELRFAVNYLAGYHLTRKILPVLRAPARIVNVASAGQHDIDFSDPLLWHGYTGWRAYGQSKLAQVMFTIDLAEELDGSGVTVNAVHPATFMDTGMVREAGVRPASTVAEGGAAVLRLLTDPALEGTTGRFFTGTEESTPHRQAHDREARQRLRALSDELIADALG